MVARRALVLVGGKPCQLPLADTLVGVPDGGGTSLPTSTSMTYDAQGRIATEVIDGVTSTYAYDAQGRISTITRPGRTETYSYDENGRFAGMTAT